MGHSATVWADRVGQPGIPEASLTNGGEVILRDGVADAAVLPAVSC